MQVIRHYLTHIRQTSHICDVLFIVRKLGLPLTSDRYQKKERKLTNQEIPFILPKKIPRKVIEFRSALIGHFIPRPYEPANYLFCYLATRVARAAKGETPKLSIAISRSCSHHAAIFPCRVRYSEKVTALLGLFWHVFLTAVAIEIFWKDLFKLYL